MATVGTLAGYVASLLQWAIYARLLGVTSATDALAAALAWMVGWTGLIGAAFSSVTLPLYLRARASDPQAARDLFRTASAVALGFGFAVAIATFVAAVPLSRVLLPGSAPSSHEELSALLRIAAPLGFLWVAVYALASLANAHGRYGWAAAATVIPSIPVIAILLLVPTPSVAQVAAGFVVGMALEAGALAAVVWPWRSHLVPGFGRGAVERLGRTAVPVVLAFLLVNISIVALRAIASFGGAGDVSVVDYATRIATAAETVLLSGALAVVLTVWSTDAARSAPERLPLVASVGLALGFIVPTAFAVAVFAPAIVGSLFGGGRFVFSDVDQVSRFLVWISLGTAAHALYLVVVRAMLAGGLNLRFLVSAVVELAVLVIAGWTLRTWFGLAGLGAAYSLAWLVAVLVAAASLKALRDRAPIVVIEAGRSIAAGVVPSAVALLALQVIPNQPLVQLVIGGAVFVGSWFVVGRLLGLAAARATLAMLPWPVGVRRRGSDVNRR